MIRLSFRRPAASFRRSFATIPPAVTIVEVGPRDGLQNEKGSVIPVAVKAQLIDRLANAGLTTIESGSFVSPKWVPQMAGTAEVLQQISVDRRDRHFPVLVPNMRGLDNLLSLLDEDTSLTDEIAVFTSATDAFNKANLNCTVADHMIQTREVVNAAQSNGLRVRGYVSVVVVCPYTGQVQPARVREVTEELIDMGCYEVSLGDTVGQATPHQVATMLEEVKKGVPVARLAGHFHDTYGTAIANVLTALQHGVRTIDASVGGLGGCPYSPGATGNVATEDVLYALQNSPYTVTDRDDKPVHWESVAEIGAWISGELGREPVSRVGKAYLARQRREKAKKEAEEARGEAPATAKL